jgi:hypothetical protein
LPPLSVPLGAAAGLVVPVRLAALMNLVSTIFTTLSTRTTGGSCRDRLVKGLLRGTNRSG